MRALLASVLLCFALTGCDPFGVKQSSSRVEDSLHAQIAQLKNQNQTMATKLASGVNEVIVNHTVTEVVKDTTAMMNWFKFIGVMLSALGVGAFCAGAVIRANPILGVISGILNIAGAALLGIGGTFFIISLTTQLALGWLPYFLFAGMALTFIGAVTYVVKHVNWSKDEVQAVKAIVAGQSNAAEHPIIKAILNQN